MANDSERIELRLTVEEKRRWMEQAKQFDLSLSEWIRRCCAHYAAQQQNSSSAAAEHFRQGKDLRLKGDYERAIAVLSEAVRLHANYADAYYHRGLAYEAMADLDRSIADLRNAAQFEPAASYSDSHDCAGINEDIARVSAARGTAFLQKGEYDAAIVDLTESIELRPLSDVRLARSRAYMALRQFKAAIDDLMAVAIINPDDKQARFDVYYRLARCHRQIGAYEQAILNAGIAIRLQPNRPKAYWLRGSCYSRAGEHGKAVMDLTAAIRLRREAATSQ